MLRNSCSESVYGEYCGVVSVISVERECFYLRGVYTWSKKTMRRMTQAKSRQSNGRQRRLRKRDDDDIEHGDWTRRELDEDQDKQPAQRPTGRLSGVQHM